MTKKASKEKLSIMITYILQVAICWGLFLGLYHLTLRKETFFMVNRTYLLLTLVIGMIIPRITWDTSMFMKQEPIEIAVDYLSYGMTQISQTLAPPATTTITPETEPISILTMIYWAGVLLMLAKLIWGIGRIYRLKYGADIIMDGDQKIAYTTRDHAPFTFFGTIYLSKLRNDEDRDPAILTHESAHVSGWHTLDVLFVETIKAFFWFNPLVYGYDHALKTVHEYIADANVLRRTAVQRYGRLLLRQAQPGLEIALANHFYNHQLKKRFKMMTRTPSQKRMLIKYLSVLPFILVVSLVFTNQEVQAEISKVEEIDISEILSLNNEDTDEENITYYPWTDTPIPFSSPSTITDFKVFNAEGEIIYSPVDFDPIWDGRLNSSQLIDEGKYPFELKKEGETKKGTITISYVTMNGVHVRPDKKASLSYPECDNLEENELKECKRSHYANHYNKYFRYPEDALKDNLEGMVFLDLVVEPDGTVSDVKVDDQFYAFHPSLAKAALSYIQRAYVNTGQKLSPGIKDGQAVKSKFGLAVSFDLKEYYGLKNLSGPVPKGINTTIDRETIKESGNSTGNIQNEINQDQTNDILWNPLRFPFLKITKAKYVLDWEEMMVRFIVKNERGKVLYDNPVYNDSWNGTFNNKRSIKDGTYDYTIIEKDATRIEGKLVITRHPAGTNITRLFDRLKTEFSPGGKTITEKVEMICATAKLLNQKHLKAEYGSIRSKQLKDRDGNMLMILGDQESRPSDKKDLNFTIVMKNGNVEMLDLTDFENCTSISNLSPESTSKINSMAQEIVAQFPNKKGSDFSKTYQSIKLQLKKQFSSLSQAEKKALAYAINTESIKSNSKLFARFLNGNVGLGQRSSYGVGWSSQGYFLFPDISASTSLSSSSKIHDFEIEATRKWDHILLKCNHGCDWLDVSGTIENSDVYINQTGISVIGNAPSDHRVPEQPLVFKARLEGTILILDGIHGMTWTQLSSEFEDGATAIFNQHGLIVNTEDNITMLLSAINESFQQSNGTKEDLLNKICAPSNELNQLYLDKSSKDFFQNNTSGRSFKNEKTGDLLLIELPEKDARFSGPNLYFTIIPKNSDPQVFSASRFKDCGDYSDPSLITALDLVKNFKNSTDDGFWKKIMPLAKDVYKMVNVSSEDQLVLFAAEVNSYSAQLNCELKAKINEEGQLGLGHEKADDNKAFMYFHPTNEDAFTIPEDIDDTFEDKEQIETAPESLPTNKAPYLHQYKDSTVVHNHPNRNQIVPYEFNTTEDKTLRIKNDRKTKFEIYNIFGNILYKSTNYQNDWDGIIDGKPIATGKYLYLARKKNSKWEWGNINITSNNKTPDSGELIITKPVKMRITNLKGQEVYANKQFSMSKQEIESISKLPNGNYPFRSGRMVNKYGWLSVKDGKVNWNSSFHYSEIHKENKFNEWPVSMIHDSEGNLLFSHVMSALDNVGTHIMSAFCQSKNAPSPYDKDQVKVAFNTKNEVATISVLDKTQAKEKYAPNMNSGVHMINLKKEAYKLPEILSSKNKIGHFSGEINHIYLDSYSHNFSIYYNVQSTTKIYVHSLSGELIAEDVLEPIEGLKNKPNHSTSKILKSKNWPKGILVFTAVKGDDYIQRAVVNQSKLLIPNK